MNNEQLNKIITDCKKLGHDVRVRDICFIILCKYLENKETVFRCLFDSGTEKDIKNYTECAKMQYLESYMLANSIGGDETQTNNASISFDENLAFMLSLKQRTQEEMDLGTVDTATGLKILADISVKLNDKFKVEREQKDQVVIVNQKYNDVCEYCGHEIYTPSKEDLIKKYNLVEKQ